MSFDSSNINGLGQIKKIFSEKNIEISEDDFALVFSELAEENKTGDEYSVDVEDFAEKLAEKYEQSDKNEFLEILSAISANDGDEENLSLSDFDRIISDEQTFDPSTLDMHQWSNVYAGNDRALGFLWQTGSQTYKTRSGLEITVEKGSDIQVFENRETGEVIVVNADGAKISSNSKDVKLKVYDSEIDEIDTGKGNDNIELHNSSVKELDTGKGLDSVSVQDSYLDSLNTGSGDDFITGSNSTIENTNTSSTFLWGVFDSSSDTVMLDNTNADSIKTGKGSDNIVISDSNVTKIKAGKGDDALSLNQTEIADLNTDKKDIVVKENNYLDIDKTKIESIESDVQIQTQDGTSFALTEYTNYVLNQDATFETEEEYQQYTLETLNENLETMKSVFAQQEDADGVLANGYNGLKELTGLGITDEDVQQMIAEQEAMINGLTAALNGESDMTFEEAYEYYTGTSYSKEKLDKYMEVSNVYSAVMIGCQYDEDYADKFKEATGKSVEDVTKEYALCQLETFGKSNSLQNLVEKYSEDQEGFADKLSAVVSGIGITCMVVGAALSFVFPPAGMALLTAGKYISLGGMFIDNAIDIVDDSTDKDGLTKEELGENALETGVEAASYFAGRFIGGGLKGLKLAPTNASGAFGQFINGGTNGINSYVTQRLTSSGFNAIGSQVIGQVSETSLDMALSLCADYGITQAQSLITTGKFMDADDYWSVDRFLGEGKNQLMGIFTGLASTKVSLYQQSVMATAQGKILAGDVDGAKSYLKQKGMGMKDAKFDEFVAQINAAKPAPIYGYDSYIDEPTAPTAPKSVEETGTTAETPTEISVPTVTTKPAEEMPIEEPVATMAPKPINETAPVDETKPTGLISQNEGKTYFQNPITKELIEITEFDEASGIYKYQDAKGNICEFNANDGIISEFKMQGKPGQQVLTLSAQTVVNKDGVAIETRKKIKTYKDGKIASYETYSADGTKKLDKKEFYPDGKTLKKQSINDSISGHTAKEISYREDGSVKIVKEYENNTVKSEIEYAENGTTILNKKTYNQNGYLQENYNSNGQIESKVQYAPNKQKLSSTTYEYDANGQIKIQTEFDGKNQKIKQTEFQYDTTNGTKSRIVTDYKNGVKVSSIEYKYDKNGNTISQIKTTFNKDGSIKSVEDMGNIDPTKPKDPLIEGTKVYPKAEDVDFSDTKQFALYLEGQIASKLMVKTEADVSEMITRISNNTGVDEATVASVMARMTGFSSYKSLPEIGSALKKLDVGALYTLDEITINNALQYVGSSKDQFFTDTGYYMSGNKKAFILDSQGLDTLAKMKTTEPTKYQKFITGVQNGNIILATVDGWNISTTDGIVTSGMFGKSTDIESLTETVVTRMQTENLSLDGALNGDIIAKAKSVLGDDIKVEVIKSDNSIGASAYSIAQQMAPNMPTQREIETTIDTLVETNMKGNGYSAAEISQARQLLSRYFDEMLTCYSADSLAMELQSKHKAIEAQVASFGKTMDDVVYIIPTESSYLKSFDVLTYQYAQVNGIDPSKIIRYNGTQSTNLNGKVIVLIDDIVGSGHSMYRDVFKYKKFLEKGLSDSHVIFTPITSLQSGYDNVTKAISDNNRIGTDTFLPSTVVNFESSFRQNLTTQEINLLDKLLGSLGYNNGGAATAMPYMLPDNNSSASGLLLSWFLNNDSANKHSSPLLETVKKRLESS